MKAEWPELIKQIHLIYYTKIGYELQKHMMKYVVTTTIQQME